MSKTADILILEGKLTNILRRHRAGKYTYPDTIDMIKRLFPTEEGIKRIIMDTIRSTAAQWIDGPPKDTGKGNLLGVDIVTIPGSQAKWVDIHFMPSPRGEGEREITTMDQDGNPYKIGEWITDNTLRMPLSGSPATGYGVQGMLLIPHNVRKGDTIFVTMDMSNKTYAVLSEIATHSGSKADAIREALSLYAHVLKERAGGGKLIIEKGDTRQEVMPFPKDPERIIA